jgi:hypothetical protein
MDLKKRVLILAGIVFLTLIIFVPMTQAEQPLDMMLCGDVTFKTIVATPELTIMGYEQRGISLDNLPSKAQDNCTYHGVGVLKIEKGKMSLTGLEKFIYPNGDLAVVEGSQEGMAEGNYKIIYGTGKWKGATGKGNFIIFTKGQPVSPGTSQSCRRVKGTYELKE